jgi:Asp-tRNA(Asn)/Glu-tRNA(Gln) amidotransferase C subunit
VLGLGPKVLKAELARLEALKVEIEKTIENLEQIGEAFNQNR